MNEPRNLGILLLEDDADDARQLKSALDKTGLPIGVHQERDGVKALQYLLNLDVRSNLTPRPDLILVDLKIHGLSGLAFIEMIKKEERLCIIPLVVFGTSTLPADISRAYSLGAASYFVKDADPDKLFETVARMCDYWFHLVRLPETHY
ncbi:MAG: response regulator [Gallionellaceae bacterium]|jgi:two-component system response regulator